MDKLTIDPSLLVLNAEHIRSIDIAPTNPPAGASATRQATGGKPPYNYHSDNYEVVNLDGESGAVISRGNAHAKITVEDSTGETASYELHASNVFLIFGAGAFSTYTQCEKAAVSQGGKIPSLKQWRSYRENYRGSELQDEQCWSSDEGDPYKRWAINLKTGKEEQLRDFGVGGQTAFGYGIKPASISKAKSSHGDE